MTHMSKRGIYAACLGVTLGVASSMAATEAAAEWKPRKPVEFVIMAGPGGGADQLARLVQSIIEESDFADVPFIPVNKGGGSGAEGLRYLKDRAGDPHVIMTTLNSFFTTPLRQKNLGVDPTTFTGIANLVEDPFILWVSANSPIESVEQWVATAKEEGTDHVVGGTGTGQEDSLVFAMLEEEYDLDLTYVPFDGGGDVAKNLIGNQVMATVNNPAEQTGFYQAGLSRPLGVLSEERLSSYPDVPTMGELGAPDLVYHQLRFVVGPPEMPKEARDYYVEVFRKVHESPKWKEYVENPALERAWLEGDELDTFIEEQVEVHSKLLTALGEI